MRREAAVAGHDPSVFARGWRRRALTFGLSAFVVGGGALLLRPTTLSAADAALQYLLIHALVDLAAVLLVVAAALALGLRLARRTWHAPLPSLALACVSLVFVALSVPGFALREAAHQRLDATLDRESAVSNPWLCSAVPRVEQASDATTAVLAPATQVAFEGALVEASLLLPPLALAFFVGGRRRRSPRPREASGWNGLPGLRPATATAALALVGIGLNCVSAGEPTRAAAQPTAAGSPCEDPDKKRKYKVAAIDVKMVLNRWGDHDPNAYMYILDEPERITDAQRGLDTPGACTDETWCPSLGLRKDVVQPLAIRATLGECVVIEFTNRLDQVRSQNIQTFLDNGVDPPVLQERPDDGKVSLHVHGLAYSVKAGAADGFAGPGAKVTYEIPIPSDPDAERAYYFHDHGGNRQRVAHGLFGALVVEPEGARFLDPEDGTETDGDGWEAIIALEDGSDFREFVLFYHEVGDENFGFFGASILDSGKQANPPLPKPLPQLLGENAFSGTLYRPSGRAINYRSESFHNRLQEKDPNDKNDREATLDRFKAHGYGSYVFGEPATPIPRSYLGEPTKTRLLHGGSEVFHVHHLHGGADRWRRNPNADPNNDIGSGLVKVPMQAFSTHLDSQSIGPGTAYNLEHECGAGGCQQAAGDFLYHCHIGQHYLAGMWGFWRVFDTAQEGLARLPARQPAPTAVDSENLLGSTIEGVKIVERLEPSDPTPQKTLAEWIEAQLPPRGTPLDGGDDASVWNWQKRGALYYGEPEYTGRAWPNFDPQTDTIGEPCPDDPGKTCPRIRFNPDNGRPAWPLLRPHLGQRPPFSPNGHAGAPWLGEQGSPQRRDGLCPDAATLGREPMTLHYPITALSKELQVFQPGTFEGDAQEVDRDGAIFVLNENIEMREGRRWTKQDEPLAIRSHVGDCVRVILTNELEEEGGKEARVNIHTHFVQFDPQASDGVITGFSYEQSVRPYRKEGLGSARLTADATAGATTIALDLLDANLRPGVWIGIGLGEGMCADPAGGPDMPCTEVRQIEAVDAAAGALTLDRPFDLDHVSGQYVGVEFVQYSWYSDTDTGTVFWHDHVDFNSWDHGLVGAHVIEPPGSTWHDPRTGDEVRSGTIVDVRRPAPDEQESFREFVLFQHKEQSGAEKRGARFDTTPREPTAGPTINLKAEPINTGNESGGRGGESAHWLSSTAHGDPWTPMPRAYVGDPFIIRHLGVVNRVAGLRLTGHRFRLERHSPDGAFSDGVPIGISERYDLVLDGGAGGPLGMAGDYLYYNTIARDFLAGAWGLIRVHDKQEDRLKPLPGRAPPAGDGFPLQEAAVCSDAEGNEIDCDGQGDPPYASVDGGRPCPADAQAVTYEVSVRELNIVSARTLPADADEPAFGAVTRGVAYQLTAADPAFTTEPLVLRVNQGQCLVVRLKNEVSQRAGFHVGELLFSPAGSFGAAVGLNPDSSIGPGETREYRFYADEELGTTVALDLAAPLNIERGAFGAVIVEPRGARYVDPLSGNPVRAGIRADVVGDDGERFREVVILLHENDDVIGHNQMTYDLWGGKESDAPTDLSHLSTISYKTTPIVPTDSVPGRALFTAPSEVHAPQHGDPALIVSGAVGSPLTMRVAAPWGEQVHVFSVDGHRWPLEPDMDGSEQVYARMLPPGYSFDAPMIGGFGGPHRRVGDFKLLDHRWAFAEAGMWGFIRAQAAATPVPDPEPLEVDRASPAEIKAALARIREARAGLEADAVGAMDPAISVHTVAEVVLELGADRGTIRYPLRRANIRSSGQRALFVLTETSDFELAKELGVQLTPTLGAIDRAAFEAGASFSGGLWEFEHRPGDVSHAGERGFVGAVGAPDYSPLKRVSWRGREVLVNAPVVWWGEGPGHALVTDRGGCDPAIRGSIAASGAVSAGPPSCGNDPQGQPLSRFLGGQAVSMELGECLLDAPGFPCGYITMKLHRAAHRPDSYPYIAVFDVSGQAAAERMGVPFAPRLGRAGTSAPALATALQFRNGVPSRSGGAFRFQVPTVSYGSQRWSIYSPLLHAQWAFYDCESDGRFRPGVACLELAREVAGRDSVLSSGAQWRALGEGTLRVTEGAEPMPDGAPAGSVILNAPSPVTATP